MLGYYYKVYSKNRSLWHKKSRLTGTGLPTVTLRVVFSVVSTNFYITRFVNYYMIDL
jgi:hypothetical protein